MVLQTSWQIAEEVWPPMNADKRGWKAHVLSALIGVHLPPQMDFS